MVPLVDCIILKYLYFRNCHAEPVEASCRYGIDPSTGSG